MLINHRIIILFNPKGKKKTILHRHKSMLTVTQKIKADGYFPPAFVRIILIDKLEFDYSSLTNNDTAPQISPANAVIMETVI